MTKQLTNWIRSYSKDGAVTERFYVQNQLCEENVKRSIFAPTVVTRRVVIRRNWVIDADGFVVEAA